MEPPIAAPSPNPTVYMQGTRRIDEMAANARQLAYSEDYSYTEGWDDNTLSVLFNLGLNRIYDKITQINQVAQIQEYTQTVQAGIQEYEIPQDVKMGIQTFNVRYLYGPETWQFVTLQQAMIEDRFSYPTNIPTTFCIRNGRLLLSPTPNITRENSLIVNYQKRMRSLDYRRGKINNTSGNLFGSVTAISNANPAQVTTATPHGLSTGNLVGLSGDFQPQILAGNIFTITVIDANDFTLNGVDSTSMGAFSGVCMWNQNPNTTLTSTYGTVSNITNANPAEVTTVTPHGLSSGVKVGIGGIFQPSELTNQAFIITVTGTNTFTLNGVDTTISNTYSGIPIWYQNPVVFQLNFTATSQKDANLQANANAILDKIDWCTFVDRNGNPIIDAIPVAGYDMVNFLITTESDYVIPFPNWSAFQAILSNQDIMYVVQGDYASTHSELDRQTEDLLIEYVVLRLLRLQSAAEPTKDQIYAEEQVLERLATAYRRYRASVVKIIWQETMRGRSSYSGGRGSY